MIPALERAYNSAAQGPARFALVILAAESNACGLVAMGGEELARRMGIGLRNARMAVAELRASGDLLWRKGGGKGVKTLYAIVSGLGPEEREHLERELLNSDRAITVSGPNSDPQISDRESEKTPNSDRAITVSGPNSDPQISDREHPMSLHDHDHDHVGFASQTPARVISIRDPNQEHPACKVFKDVIGIRPNKSQAQAIAQGYTTERRELRPPVEDLDLWRRVVETWRRMYANSINVVGMLDWYHEPARMAQRAGGAHGTNTAGRSPGGITAAQQARERERIRALELELEREDVRSPNARAAG